jgi:membrane protease YdiL (CAAX protease family)
MRTFWLNRQGEIRAGWRMLAYGGLTILLALPVLRLYSYLSKAEDRAGSDRLFTSVSLLLYTALCAATLLPALLLLLRVDKRPVAYLGFAPHERLWIEIRQGLVQGLFLVTLIFFIGWGTGWLRVSWSNMLGVAAIWQTGFYLTYFVLAAAFEELLWRGYAFQALVQGIGKISAVAISAALFGVAHLANPHANLFGMINTMLAGMWLSAAYLRTRSLWLPTSLHAAWNFFQGFLFGFPVSGLICPETILQMSPQGPAWITGGEYGPEAGALCTFVLLAATLYVTWAKRIQPAANEYALWHPREKEC